LARVKIRRPWPPVVPYSAMKKVVKVLGVIVVLLVVLAGGGVGYLYLAYPKAGAAPTWTVGKDAELVERGRYLANRIAVCIDCHSTRDWSKFGGPPIPGTEGKGGEVFPEEFGFPGTFVAPNITPAGIGSWTDGEIARTFTTGVNAKGRPLFPIMPYLAYRTMCERDVRAIVAYVRTLSPIENQVPESKPSFPFSLILRTIPGPPDPQPCVEPAATAEYGKYLVKLASCVECHTPAAEGKLIAGREFGGGREFPMPWGLLRSANITPDDTGIGKWTEEQFIGRFRAYADKELPVKEGEFNSIMPWTMYGGMSDLDLRAIYAYLRTQQPIANRVEPFTAKGQ